MSSLTSRARAVIVATFLIANLSHAQWWNPKSVLFERDAKQADTLIVTGNYIKSRMVAELFQRATKQPILLLPSPGGNGSFYFLSPKKSVEIQSADFVRFIEFLQPKKIVLMGNEEYAPARYVDMLGGDIPLWTIRNNDWEKIAATVGDMFGIKQLLHNYLLLQYQLDESGGIKAPASTDEYGGYTTKGERWNPEESAAPKR